MLKFFAALSSTFKHRKSFTFIIVIETLLNIAAMRSFIYLAW